VPRLTLLFFGETKDVPEAAKMVAAGTACLHFDRKSAAIRGLVVVRLFCVNTESERPDKSQQQLAECEATCNT